MVDRAGQPLSVGDLVTITAVVTELYGTEDYHNALLETDAPMPPDGTKTLLTVNTRQVARVAPVHEEFRALDARAPVAVPAASSP